MGDTAQITILQGIIFGGMISLLGFNEKREEDIRHQW